MQRNRAAIIAAFVVSLFAVQAAHAASPPKIVGMYIHQHWPYNHPYAARTWTLDDWRGYAGALKRLGFNTVMIWPVIETMPYPPSASDRASLEKTRTVIDMLHQELGMRVWITLCPNVIADDQEAAKAPFEKRHFFYCDRRVNPADRAQMARMMKIRQSLLEPLKNADAFSIIDSDPGGYPGSTNAEFVRILGEHRKLFDKLRPGIEIYYWMHAGWEAYCRFYQTGVLKLGSGPELTDTLVRLSKLNPEPWGLANGLEYAQKLGLESRVISFRYGRIESEPSFPMTNFGGNAAYDGGSGGGAPRGVIGNAQTHCVQLPNTFAFARGAQGRPVTESDYIQFAGDVIPGQGKLIVQAWKALAGTDAGAMRTVMSQIRGISPSALKPGPLGGLLFGSPARFIEDLVFQLRMRAEAEDFFVAVERQRGAGEHLRRFADAAGAWQRQHGYESNWRWDRLLKTLEKLNLPEIREVLNPAIPETGFEHVRRQLYLTETMTPRLLEAMKKAAARLGE